MFALVLCKQSYTYKPHDMNYSESVQAAPHSRKAFHDAVQPCLPHYATHAQAHIVSATHTQTLDRHPETHANTWMPSTSTNHAGCSACNAAQALAFTA